MSTDHIHHTVVALKLTSLAVVLAMVVGAMVLVGWAFDIAALKSILPGWVAMKANTAVCFILTGIALWLTASPPETFNSRLSTLFFHFARLCGLLVGLIGLLTLCEYIFGWNPGIDQWLFREPSGTVGTSYPGRMAPETALCFALLAAALWITGGSRKTRWTILASVSFGLLVTTLALAAMLSYPTPGLGAYGWFGLTIMAMHTSVLFAMLGMAVIAISWQPDVLQWLLSRNTTAAFACGMAVLVLIGFNTNRSQFWLGETNRKIAYSEEAQDYIENILIEIIDAQTHTRGYVITGDEQFKTHYLEAKANSNVNLDALRKLIASNPHQQQQFARIEVQAKAQLQWLQQVIDARQTSMTDATRNNMIRYGEGLMDNFRITHDQIKNEHQQFINGLRQEAESVSRFSYITIATGMLASMLIFLSVIFRLNFAVSESKLAEERICESVARYRGIFENSNDIIYLLNLDGTFNSLSPAFERITGWTAEEWIGKPFAPIIHPDDLSDANTVFQKMLSGESTQSFRLRIARKSGQYFNADLSITPLGSNIVMGIARDVSERKRVEELLNNMASKFQAVFESSADAIMLLDERGFFEANETALRLFCCPTLDDFIGKHPVQFSPPNQPGGEDSMSLANAHIATAFKNGSNRFEWMFRRLDGTEFPSEVLLNAMELDGKPVIECSIRDITERKLAESQLAEQLDELRRWHKATSSREKRILELKNEMNELLGKSGLPPRYPSATPVQNWMKQPADE